MSGTLPQGATLNNGRYVIESILGQGGFGVTYRCQDTHIDRTVAIKEMFISGMMLRGEDGVTLVARKETDVASVSTEKKHFLRQAALLAAIRDGNVVTVYDCFEEHGTAYMVMEFLTGQSFAAQLKARGTIPASESFALLLPVMDAMARLHTRGILHRDIAPDNMITDDVCGKPVMKLIDFGAAGTVRQGKSVVKVGYTPLESYNSNGLDSRSDIYAMSAVLYEAITGHTPTPAAERAIMGDQLSLEPDESAGFTAPMAEILRKGLMLTPEDRWQSFEEMTAAIRALSGPTAAPNADVPAAVPVTGKGYARRSRHMLLIAAAVLCIALAGFVIQRIIDRQHQEQEDIRSDSNASIPANPGQDSETVTQNLIIGESVNLVAEPASDETKTDTEIIEAPITDHPIVAPDPTESSTVDPDPTEAPTSIPLPAVGDVLTLGRYEQDAIGANGREPVEWQVLAVEDGKVLLLSRYALDCVLFHENKQSVSWAESDIRQWLNSIFFSSVFTPEEQRAILQTQVLSDGQGLAGWYNDDSESFDYVFLLSYRQAWTYLPTATDRMAKPTAYALERDAWYSSANGTTQWWLRSMGENRGLKAVVKTNGDLNCLGQSTLNGVTVRPAMWVDLSLLPAR